MSPIDEDGYLFGRVNVFDAAAVVLVLVAVAGAVVVLDPFASPDEPATRYATIDLGEQPHAVAERLSTGDVSDGDRPGSNLTVTDAYVGPAGPGNASVVVRARIAGTATGPGQGDDASISFRGATVQRGDDLDVETESYDVEGTVLDVTGENATLDTGTLPVLVEANVTAATAARVQPGDAYRIDDRTVATVERATVVPTRTSDNRTVLVGLSLRTIRLGGNTHFGAEQVLVGQRLRFATERYGLTGSVVRWGSTSLPGEPTNATAVVKLSNVEPDVADGLEPGMVERRDGRTAAEIVDARTDAATVVLTSDDGNIYARDHPINRTVSLTVDLRARRTDDGLRFHTRPLREGSTIVLDFRTIQVQGTVVSIDE